MNAFAEALTPKVAVSYLRVSTTGQARRGRQEGFSIPAQRDANKRKAASLGAMVIKEFVDRGASARSANRPELQRMLEYVNEHDVDYVIVHKLDRLARNRSDDVEIVRALEAANVQLVSTTEAIDATPSGMLLHGIMSSIAEFYSRNLVAEVTKGLSTKAQRGGTVSKAPIGYRNHRTVDDQGRELRTVIVDADRAQYVKDAFGLYATGAWTVAALADQLASRGFTTVPTPKVPSKPMNEKYLHRVLTRPYYRGIVTYKGVQYDGRHERLINDETWFKVQSSSTATTTATASASTTTTTSRTACGADSAANWMLVTNSKSSSGEIHPYFYCAGRHSKRTSCTQRSVLIYEIERKVETSTCGSNRRHLPRPDRDPAPRRTQRCSPRRRATTHRAEEVERTPPAGARETHGGPLRRAIPVDLLGQELRTASARRWPASRPNSTPPTRSGEVIRAEPRPCSADLATDTHSAYLSAPEHIHGCSTRPSSRRSSCCPTEDAHAGVRLERTRGTVRHPARQSKEARRSNRRASQLFFNPLRCTYSSPKFE
ncbi:MAG: recombinase family protein [Marmoricola sp.]